MRVTSIARKQVPLSHLAGIAKLQSNVLTGYTLGDEPLDGVSLPLSGVKVHTRQGDKAATGVYVTSAPTVRVEFGRSFIECTNTHKLFSSNRGWVAAEHLTVGDSLLDQDGISVPIASVQPAGVQEVMDICVEDVHEYYANGVVSHNSVVANQLNVNQASLGYKTIMVPLEMSAEEMISRTASNLSGMSSIDIFLKRLASGERDLVWKRFIRHDKKIAAAGGRYTIFKPKEDLTIEELMASLHTYKSDIIYVDYITLLKGADGDDQWRKLGQIARFSKIYAENYNKVVVLLAQVTDEGKLRYSQTIKEHTSLSLTFVATKETKEKGYLNIEVPKSRNQVDRPFTLRIDYAKMQVRDLEPEELQRLEGDRRAKPDKSGKPVAGASPKNGKASDYTPDLTE